MKTYPLSGVEFWPKIVGCHVEEKPRTEDGGHGGITTVWEISTYPTFNLKKGHDRHGASLQTHPNKQLPFKTHPISSLRVHRALRARILLLGFAIKPSSQPHHLAGEQRIGERLERSTESPLQLRPLSPNPCHLRHPPL